MDDAQVSELRKLLEAVDERLLSNRLPPDLAAEFRAARETTIRLLNEASHF